MLLFEKRTLWGQTVCARILVQWEKVLFVAVLVGILAERTATASPTSDGSEVAEWSSWQRWGACNRRCGDGVRQRMRGCQKPENNPDAECTGDYQMWEYCLHGQACNQTLREEECAAFNNGTKTWRPIMNQEDDQRRCELVCEQTSDQASHMVERKKSAAPGTKCRSETRRDICLHRLCQTLPCPYDMDEITQGCQPGSCAVICGEVQVGYPQSGVWQPTLEIPQCASKVTFTQLEGKMDLKLASISNDTQELVNLANYREQTTFTLASADFVEDVSGSHKVYRTEGQLNASIILVAVYEEAKIGYHYRLDSTLCTVKQQPEQSESVQPSALQSVYDVLYIDQIGKQHVELPSSRADRRNQNPMQLPDYHFVLPGENDLQQTVYRWRRTDFGECSRSCGGGYQIAEVACISSTTGTPIDDYLCINDGFKPAPVNRLCSNWSCLAEWHTSDWGECYCGDDQVQERNVTCRQVIHNGDTVEVPGKLCIGLRPEHERSCSSRCTVRWHIGHYSRCSATCARGQKVRTVHCMQGDKIIGDSLCLNLARSKPREVKPCNGSCLMWVPTEWAECSAGCGDGYQTRAVLCVDQRRVGHSGTVRPDRKCRHFPKPQTFKLCYETTTCSPGWHTSDYGPCSAPCGTSGRQFRDVSCMQGDPVTNILHKVNDTACWRMNPSHPKPSRELACNRVPCMGRWARRPWGKCSTFCGPGKKYREVRCEVIVNGETVVDATKCDPEFKPRTQRNCSRSRRYCTTASPPPDFECIDIRPTAKCKNWIRNEAHVCETTNTGCCKSCLDSGRIPFELRSLTSSTPSPAAINSK